MSMELETLRHSYAHLMAHAVQNIFGDVKFGIGPSTDTGFYYDFDMPHTLTPEDLLKIEDEMKNILKEKKEFLRETLSREQALSLFKDQTYKVELIRDLPEGEEISTYTVGSFVDLCRGPHVPDTGKLRTDSFKLLSIAGAYWRGSEHNPMLQRIYGTGWASKKELKEHLAFLEEADRRDHRKLTKELDFFSIPAEAGPGLALFHPNGAIVRKSVEDFEYRQHVIRDYQLVYTPHVYVSDVWKISGHYDFYKENMFLFEKEDREYGVKPMNCPGHVFIYQSQPRSYRDMPVKYFEHGTVYRRELSGALHGLMRVTNITQDDAHIFCRRDQLKDQIIEVLEFADFMMATFGFETGYTLSTRPEKSLGTDDIWEHATAALKDALQTLGKEYNVDDGGGAFYGPKIDVMMRDALKREWQGPTIQVDFNFPERFDLTYVNAEGEKERPVMVHRTVLGSMERFTGVLIEHFAGRFPLWLAPTQVLIMPITSDDALVDYASNLRKLMREKGVRAQADLSSNTLNYKIRGGQTQRVPYIVIVGAKEVENNTISIRVGHKGDQRQGLSVDEFLASILNEIDTRAMKSPYEK